MSAQNPVDSLYYRNGKIEAVVVAKSTKESVEFTYPNESSVNTVSTSDLLKIRFSSGREEVYSQPLEIPVITSPSQWKMVVVTDNYEDVRNLVKVKELKVNTGAGMAMYQAAKKKAIIKLKKEAAKLGCGVVYMPEPPHFNFSVKGYGTAYRLQ